jgi:hypothetical protein
MAIAKSNHTAAAGYVIEAQVKNEDFLPTWEAIRLNNNKPNADIPEQIVISIIPFTRPVAATADGYNYLINTIATIPEPNIVFVIFVTDDRIVPW